MRSLAPLALAWLVAMPAQADEAPVGLIEGLGSHQRKIDTTSPEAQRFFDKGLVLAYGFNHAAAGRAFRQALVLDPLCAMCAWGVALVLGPHINAARFLLSGSPSNRNVFGRTSSIRSPVFHVRLISTYAPGFAAFLYTA